MLIKLCNRTPMKGRYSMSLKTNLAAAAVVFSGVAEDLANTTANIAGFNGPVFETTTAYAQGRGGGQVNGPSDGGSSGGSTGGSSGGSTGGSSGGSTGGSSGGSTGSSGGSSDTPDGGSFNQDGNCCTGGGGNDNDNPPSNGGNTPPPSNGGGDSQDEETPPPANRGGDDEPEYCGAVIVSAGNNKIVASLTTSQWPDNTPATLTTTFTHNVNEGVLVNSSQNDTVYRQYARASSFRHRGVTIPDFTPGFKGLECLFTANAEILRAKGFLPYAGEQTYTVGSNGNRSLRFER